MLPGRQRVRRLQADEGLPVPWLSALFGVYCVAMLNAPFWKLVRHESLLTGLTAWVGYLFLFMFLAAGFALVAGLSVPLCGKPPLLVLLVFSALNGACLEARQRSVVGLARADSPDAFLRPDILWPLCLFGVVPALLLVRQRLARRPLKFAWGQTARFGLGCLGVGTAGLAGAGITGFLPSWRLLRYVNPLDVLLSSDFLQFRVAGS